MIRAYTKQELAQMSPAELRARLEAAPTHDTVSKQEGDRVLYWCNTCEMIVGIFDLKTREYKPKKGIIDARHSGSWSASPDLKVEMNTKVKKENRSKWN